MIETILDFVARSFQLDTGGWLVLISFVGAGYVLMSQMLADHGSAVLGAPFIIFGTALGNRGFADLGLQFHGDKLMNMSIGMAASMLASGILAILILWTWNATMAR